MQVMLEFFQQMALIFSRLSENLGNLEISENSLSVLEKLRHHSDVLHM